MAESYIKGTEELQSKLRALSKTVAKSAIRKGTRAGSKIIAQRAKDTAPVKTGELRRAIKVRALPRSKRWVGTTVKLEIRYGAAEEFGTRKMTGKHFLEQAADQEKRQATDTALATMQAEIEARMVGQ